MRYSPHTQYSTTHLQAPGTPPHSLLSGKWEREQNAFTSSPSLKSRASGRAGWGEGIGCYVYVCTIYTVSVVYLRHITTLSIVFIHYTVLIYRIIYICLHVSLPPYSLQSLKFQHLYRLFNYSFNFDLRNSCYFNILIALSASSGDAMTSV